MTKLLTNIISLFDRPQKFLKYDHKIPISRTIVIILISADSPECPQMRYGSLLNSDIWPNGIQEGAGNLWFLITSVLLFPFLFFAWFLWGLQPSLFILDSHSVTLWCRSGHHTSSEREHSGLSADIRIRTMVLVIGILRQNS